MSSRVVSRRLVSCRYHDRRTSTAVRPPTERLRRGLRSLQAAAIASGVAPHAATHDGAARVVDGPDPRYKASPWRMLGPHPRSCSCDGRGECGRVVPSILRRLSHACCGRVCVHGVRACVHDVLGRGKVSPPSSALPRPLSPLFAFFQRPSYCNGVVLTLSWCGVASVVECASDAAGDVPTVGVGVVAVCLCRRWLRHRRATRTRVAVDVTSGRVPPLGPAAVLRATRCCGGVAAPVLRQVDRHP